jgi:hypothetical protein
VKPKVDPVETKTATLASAGYNYKKITRHVYAHSEVITIPGPKKGETLTGLGHYYRCEETKELRRWGFDVTFAKDNGAN